MSGKWVDFKTIKEKVSMEMVLVHYGLLAGFKKTSHGFRGPCPIHKGKHPNQFHVDPVKNRWNCFGGCDMEALEGHVIGFVAAMEGVDLREAALMIAEWYDLSTERPDKISPRSRRKADSPAPPAKSPAPVEKAAPVSAPGEEPENKELSFELKNLSVDHPFFQERGIAAETVQQFGLGFCSRGLMKDRIVFPLHRHDGKLIGYLGRTVREITDDNPKWLLPPGLIKPKVLFNFHRMAGIGKTVIVVEGPLDLVAVLQAGFPNVVALLGKELLSEPSLSYDQFRLITQNFSQAILLLDGDPDGQEAASNIAGKLAREIYVRIVPLPPDKDPSDLEPDALRHLLNF
jgi:DNA primase